MKCETPLWLIITGPPAAGKTTLARRIAPDLRLPLFEKDAFKDMLYQTLGFGDKNWSRKIGQSAINMMFLTADQMLGAGASVITESNFYRQFNSERVAELADRAEVRVLQIHCSAPPNVLVKRNADRIAPANHRPGHHVMPSEELLGGIESGTWEPLNVPSKIIHVDTSGNFDYANLLLSIHEHAPHLSRDVEENPHIIPCT